jgi:hypothetical protein
MGDHAGTVIGPAGQYFELSAGPAIDQAPVMAPTMSALKGCCGDPLLGERRGNLRLRGAHVEHVVDRAQLFILIRPISCPSGSAKSAIWPFGMSIGPIARLPPSDSAFDSAASMSSTWT